MFIDWLLFQVSHLPLDFCHLVATYEELISLAGLPMYYVLCISLCFTKTCPSWVPSWYWYLCCMSGLWSLTSSSLWKLLSQKWQWISVSSWTFLWSLYFSLFVKDLTQEWQTNANSQKIFPIEKMIPGKTGAGCQLCDPISGFCPRYTVLFFI